MHVSISQTKVLMFYFFSLKKCRNVCSFQRKTTVLETLISTLKTHVQLQREKILEFRCRHLYAICPENHYLQDVGYIIVQLSISLISLVWILLSSKKNPSNLECSQFSNCWETIEYLLYTNHFNTATANIYFFPSFRILYSKRNSSYSICCLFLFELLRNLCVSALLVRIFTEKQVVFMTKYAIIVQLSVSLISFVHIFKF